MLDSLPPRTDADRARLKALAERPDSEIDLSDIPEWTEEQFKRAKRRQPGQSLSDFFQSFRPIKRQITARIDADVLDWLKADGKGYQSRINAILRREMLAACEAPDPAPSPGVRPGN